MRRASLAFLVVLGCSHDHPAVVQPDDHPPLPPASGTPIGYLVDDAGELALRDDQLSQLKAIDDDLAARLAVLDGDVRGASAAPAASASAPTAGRRRGGGGGRRGGGRRGMAGGGGSGGAAPGPRPTGGASPDRANRAIEERAADVRGAIDKALGLLDVGQRIIARRVLADHGVDLDAGRPQAAPAGRAEPAEPDDSEPDEPDAGSGSP
ncbi:MAG TPA: hypothetical protein VGD37_26345 [Kofleriaceae bacterium]|jgi:hypothetical protein